MTCIIIRPARLDDAAALHTHCYPETAPGEVRDYLAWCLRRPHRERITRLVAEVEGQAVANIQLTAWGRTGEIGSLVVSEGFRRRGIARRLLAAATAEARRRELEALEIGVSARQPHILAFYEGAGFCQDGDKKKGLFRSTSFEPVVLLRRLL